jgi:G2/mitotic-specific cyclin 1/2
VKKAASVSAPVKAGAKRPLAGVAANVKQEDAPVDKGESCLDVWYIQRGKLTYAGKAVMVEARQPLGARTNNATSQARAIAPVPQRARPAIYAPAELPAPAEEEEMVSEMDVDATRMDEPAIHMDAHLDEEASEEELSEEEDEEEDEEDWTKMSEEEEVRAAQQLAMVRATFHDDIDMFDTTMVAEYADEIFNHMEHLEIATMPNPRYMDFQTEIEW